MYGVYKMLLDLSQNFLLQKFCALCFYKTSLSGDGFYETFFFQFFISTFCCDDTDPQILGKRERMDGRSSPPDSSPERIFSLKLSAICS